METLDVTAKSRMEPMKVRFRWLWITKAAYLLVNVLYVFLLLAMSKHVEGINNGDMNAVRGFEGLIGFFIVVSFLLFATVVLNLVMTMLWVYRAGLNLHLLEMPGLRFSPGWYVGWFFIPVAWWFMPFLGLAETGKASASLNDRDNWQKKPVPVSLLVWYIILLALTAYSIINWSMAERPPRTSSDPLLALAQTIPGQIVPAIIGVFAYIILAVPSLIFAKKVTDQQDNFKNA